MLLLHLRCNSADVRNVHIGQQTCTGAKNRRQHTADLAFLDGIHNVHDGKLLVCALLYVE